MHEFGISHTPIIQYITDTNVVSLNYTGKSIFNLSPFDYERLFNFINYDLSPLSEQLLVLYNSDYTNSTTFIHLVNQVLEHVEKIFFVSHFPATIDFIEADYTEYTAHKYYHAQSTSEKQAIKARYKDFLITLRNLSIHNSLICTSQENAFDNFYTQIYCEEQFTKKINSTCNLTTCDIPPCNLHSIQLMFQRILKGNISKNELHRLRCQDKQTRAEYLTLITSAKNKPRNQRSLSEDLAWDIHITNKLINTANARKMFIQNNTTETAQKRIMGKKESRATNEKENIKSVKFRKIINVHESLKNKNYTKSNCPPPSIPITPITYERAISIDFSYVPRNINEFAYTFNYLEDILVLEFSYFLKSNQYIFQCPNCKKIFNSSRVQFFCTQKCKDAHRQYILSSCPPWNKYEKIRKKIYARAKYGSYTSKEKNAYINRFSDILSQYFEGTKDATTVLKELSEENEKIDSNFKELHEQKIWGSGEK